VIFTHPQCDVSHPPSVISKTSVSGVPNYPKSNPKITFKTTPKSYPQMNPKQTQKYPHQTLLKTTRFKNKYTNHFLTAK
jgi:hypothetical protein